MDKQVGDTAQKIIMGAVTSLLVWMLVWLKDVPNREQVQAMYSKELELVTKEADDNRKKVDELLEAKYKLLNEVQMLRLQLEKHNHEN